MGERISAEDARMMYKDTLCEYKGDLVFVAGIGNDMETLIREVSSMKLKRVKFDTDDFAAPSRGRLGYVNFGQMAVYMFRNPRRMYKNGLCQENIETKMEGGFRYTAEEERYVAMMLQRPLDPCFQETYAGNFPSLEDAVKKVANKEARLIAFDRQFAVASDGKVYYKNQFVGGISLKTGKTAADIKWQDGWESIMMLATNQFKLGGR